MPDQELYKPEDRAAGVVFNVMRYSLHDGPGIRTTVFLKGCPLRCRWCHNPESQDFAPCLMFAAQRCRLCGDCVSVCPRDGLRDPAVQPIPGGCIACGACAEACLAGARQLAGRRTTVRGLMEELDRDVLFFDESGGGVTLSGGEPLSQPEFAASLLKACRELRIHTTLDTCGFAPRHVALEVSAWANLVLYDLKAIDSGVHRAMTGAGNREILENLAAMVEGGRNLIVRIPLVPGVNDNDGELNRMAEFTGALGLRRIDLLPFHKLGVDKYHRMGLTCPARETEPPSRERVESVASSFRERGFQVRIGG